jgi:PAS domain S-box-containing protein
MSETLRVLIVEDSESDAGMIIRLLHKADYDVHAERVDNAGQMQAALEKQAWDVVIADYRLPQFDAPAALALVRQSGLDIPFIVVSGTIGEDLAVAMMKAGAHDYLMKDKLARLAPAVVREIREARARRERWQADEALRESEARFSSIFHASPAAIAIARLRDSQFIDVNAAWQNITGYTRAEAIGHTSLELNLWAKPEQREQLVRSLREQGAARGEVQVRRKSGQISDVLMSAELIDVAGENCLLTMAQDITERKQAETALAEERALLAERVKERTAELNAANAELVRAARAKNEFLAAMSHELRTPLNAILTVSEGLQEQVFGPLNEKQLNFLHIIEESGRHLLVLINDILDLSKIEAGKVELETAPVVVSLVCQASLQFVRQSAHEKQIELSFDLDSQVATIEADERRLKQILVNLLSNAVKFTPAGGRVGLEVKGDAEQGVLRFCVWDTGIGIAPEDVARLFQPFVQLDSRLSRQYSGTGLGLSLVLRLVDLHGGSVGVESAVGKGSRFTVSLPWGGNNRVTRGESDRATEEEASPGVTVSSPHPVTILLAEDNEAHIAATSAYLQAKGYRVILARHGHEAVQAAEVERPDVIVMDIQMPGLDGMEAIRRIRDLPSPCEGEGAGVRVTPILALTALAIPGDRERCLAAGADEYMSKPVSLKCLAAAIEDSLLRKESP